MNISINAKSVLTNNSDCIVVALTGSSPTGSLADIDKASKGYIKALLNSKDLENKRGKCTTLFQVPGIKSKRLVIIGSGKSKDLNPKTLGDLYRSSLKEAEKTGAQTTEFYLHEITTTFSLKEHIRIASESLLSSYYRFDSQKSKSSKASSVKKLAFSINSSSTKLKSDLKSIINSANALVKGINLCKDLGNLPGNVCTPTYLAKEAQKMASAPKVSVKVIDEKSFARLGMGAFLSVAKGSEQPAKLIVINYLGGKKGEKPHVLVGKGITFDSGGISLKPGAAMDEMKYDMCGAASVMGTMSTIINEKIKLNVVAIIAAAENMPSSRASKPGDIVKSMSGLTIEILNTDAEGRLVLCDALTYAEQFKPASVIDVATLTGACVVALGNHATALYSNNDKLAEKIEKAGNKAWDRVWPMPLWPEYDVQLNSRFADLANIGGPKAGSVTAACFLANFAKKYPWAHLDIAGTAWFGPGPNKGSTGRPVPLLVNYLRTQAH
jgi:leucyl aminopeptidase